MLHARVLHRAGDASTREILGVVEARIRRRRLELAFELDDVAGLARREHTGADEDAACRVLPLLAELDFTQIDGELLRGVADRGIAAKDTSHAQRWTFIEVRGGIRREARCRVVVSEHAARKYQ